jgi:hypothetical protein
MTRRARLEVISARNEVKRIRERKLCTNTCMGSFPPAVQRVLNVDLQARREKLEDAEARRASASQVNRRGQVEFHDLVLTAQSLTDSCNVRLTV